MKLDTFYVIVLSIFVVVVVVLTFVFPFRSLRLEALDSTMSSALDEVSNEIKSYADENNELPDDLTKLEFNEAYSVVNNNSGIINKITYNKEDTSGTLKFNLCADFYTEKKEAANSFTNSFFSEDSSFADAYINYNVHAKGYHCFNSESVNASSSFSESLQDYYDQYYNSEDATDSSTDTEYFN